MMKRGCFSVCSAIYILAICIAIVEGLYTAEWAVEITDGGEGRALSIANKYGLRNLGKIGGLENMYHFNKTKGFMSSDDDSDITESLKSELSDGLVEKQYNEQRQVKSISGPNLQDQKQDDEERNISVRVEQAWLQNLSGCGVSIAVVDDEIDVYDDDLWRNFAPTISFDFHGDDFNPGDSFDDNLTDISEQGTTCSRIIASSEMANGSCDLGIAYQSNLGGIQIFSLKKDNTRNTTDVTEAKALSFKRDTIDIYINCWGALDNGADVIGPRNVTKRTLLNGVTKGRCGKGSIYVWANGNGGPDDDCAADGYASSLYTISVGAISDDGTPTFYDEPCSAKLTVAPERIGCNMTYTGTSAAASTASGIIALALEANPSLTWRDVQYLIAYTANPHLTAGPLTRNGAGLAVSRQYGFGVMDAEAMVTRARHWINIPSQMIDSVTPDDYIRTAYNTHPFTTTVNYAGEISFLEHVIVKISVFAAPRGGIEIKLQSPSGTDVILLQNRPNDTKHGDYYKWPFMSVMFWGEDPTGTWTLTISHNDSSSGVVNIKFVEFEFYGVLNEPMVVARIPQHCHPDCERGCAAIGSEYCDSCKYLRNANTLECINDDKCPNGYSKKNTYCYDNASTPLEECESLLKNKTKRICIGNYTGECKHTCIYTFLDNECGCYDSDKYQLDDNGKNCSDINECMRDDHGCDGMCENIEGGYNCTSGECHPDYERRVIVGATICIDENKCNIPEDNECKQICVNLPGPYYECNCSTGYTLAMDNRTCLDDDECESNIDTCGEHECMNLNGTYECNCSDGYLLNADRHSCTEIDFISGSRNITGDDNISPPIKCPKFPVGCTNVTTVYVGTNGYFTFDGFTGFTPFSFDRGNGLSLVAPFFIDIDDPQKHGSIKYEVHNNSTFEVAERINRMIRKENDPSFCGKWFLIANWENVSPYRNKTISITFEGILATNFHKTFAVFTYKCNGDKFPANPAVGYVTDGMAFNHDAALKENAHEFICNTNEHYSRIVYDISVCEPQPDC